MCHLGVRLPAKPSSTPRTRCVPALIVWPSPSFTRALVFSVWNSADVSDNCSWSTSHFAPISMLRERSGDRSRLAAVIWSAPPPRPPFAPGGFDDVPCDAYRLTVCTGLNTRPNW